MKTLSSYITEKLKISKSRYTLHPKDCKELRSMIIDEISENGLECDLNHIDVTGVKSFSHLFEKMNFNGDISKWDLSKSESTAFMFYNNTSFNGDISGWDMSNIKDMSSMFRGSKFNGNISDWDVSSVENMDFMFKDSEFNQDISNWDVSSCDTFSFMFDDSKFNHDISNWDLTGCQTYQMFGGTKIRQSYKPKGVK